MIFLMEDITVTQGGVLSVLALLVVGLLQIIKYIVRKKFEEKPEEEIKKILQEVKELLINLDTKTIRQQVNDLFDCHLGKRAIKQDSVLRWYVPDDLSQRIMEAQNIQGKVLKVMEAILKKLGGTNENNN